MSADIEGTHTSLFHRTAWIVACDVDSVCSRQRRRCPEHPRVLGPGEASPTMGVRTGVITPHKRRADGRFQNRAGDGELRALSLIGWLTTPPLRELCQPWKDGGTGTCSVVGIADPVAPGRRAPSPPHRSFATASGGGHQRAGTRRRRLISQSLSICAGPSAEGHGLELAWVGLSNQWCCFFLPLSDLQVPSK